MPVTRIVAVACLALLLAGCSGKHSTLEEGLAYRMSPYEAVRVAEDTIAAHVPAGYTLPTEGLTASGYKRVLIDTHTFSISAMPAQPAGAYGFEVSHHGTLFQGPGKADAIYTDVKQRAARIAQTVQLDGE